MYMDVYVHSRLYHITDIYVCYRLHSTAPDSCFFSPLFPLFSSMTHHHMCMCHIIICICGMSSYVYVSYHHMYVCHIIICMCVTSSYVYVSHHSVISVNDAIRRVKYSTARDLCFFFIKKIHIY